MSDGESLMRIQDVLREESADSQGECTKLKTSSDAFTSGTMGEGTIGGPVVKRTERYSLDKPTQRYSHCQQLRNISHHKERMRVEY
jgi:hypothetical protein